jgi:transcriptional regulator of acetoin/glycerol metabolism
VAAAVKVAPLAHKSRADRRSILILSGTMQHSPPAETKPAAEASGLHAVSRTIGLRWIFPATDGRFTSLLAPVTSLGRDPSCGICLPDDEVSREHATLRRQGEELILRDAGSRNGTQVNGVRRPEVVLQLGDVVRLGSWIGVVTMAAVGDPGYRRLGDGALVGPDLSDALAPAFRAAPTGLPVLIEGETGTGKEIAARLLHDSAGRPGPFVAVNCAAIPESLAEAELFGFAKGAFTGADQARPGYLRAASCGTLLLDEVIDLPLGIQAKLLRALERSEVTPIGESRPVPVDLRIVAAAQEPLQRAVDEKRFRGDLYARLNGILIQLPPLRHRRQEIPFLFRELLASAGEGAPPTLSPRLVERLCLHDWPYNVRELALLARRMRSLFAGETLLSRSHLPAEYRGEPAAARAAPPTDDEALLAALKDALRRCGGNLTRAAAQLDISRPRAYRLMKGFELSVDQLRDEVA